MKKMIAVSALIILLIGGLMPMPISLAFKLAPAHINVTIEGDLQSVGDEVAQRIRMTNERDVPVDATVIVEKPSKVTENYTAIPDISWIKIVPDKLHIPANSVGYANIYINIPPTEENYNKSWEALITATQLPNEGESINIALSARMKINVASIESIGDKSIMPYLYGLVGVIACITGAFLFKRYKSHKESKDLWG